MESGINISVPYQIDIVKWYGFSYRFFWFIYQQIMILEDGNNIYSKLFFLHISINLC